MSDNTETEMSDAEHPSELAVSDVIDVLGSANQYENEGRGVRVSHRWGFSSAEMDALADTGWKIRVDGFGDGRGDLLVWPRHDHPTANQEADR